MSFEDAAPVEGVTAEVGPAEAGEAEQQAPEPSEEGVEQEPVRQYVEVDDPDNRYVRTRIDGEDVEIPFSEALKGYSREAHFTRNMQQLAQQRQEAEFGLRLQQALEANPEITLEILAKQHGYNLVPPQAPPAQDEPEFNDPLEREIVQERQARQALEERFAEREADEQLHRAVAGLRSQFNLSDEDVQRVVATAYQMNLGIQALPMVYKTMQFDRIDARVRAQRAEQQRQQAETQRRQQAKSQAGAIVGSGRGSASGLTSQVDAGGRMTLREAIEAAFDAAGG